MKLSNTFSTGMRSNTSFIILVVIALFCVVFYWAMIPQPTVSLNHENLKISGPYGTQISYRDIAEVDTVSILPLIEIRTNGFSFGGHLKGYFKLANVGIAILFVNTHTRFYLYMRLNNDEVIYLNFADKQKTITLFQQLEERMPS